jgi:O-antigen/teichoic acid export membrane protein
LVNAERLAESVFEAILVPRMNKPIGPVERAADDPTAATAHDGPETVEGGLSGTVVTGAKWKILTALVGEGSRVVVALVLARLLTPEDYGVAGMAIVTTSFVVLFSDPALGTALVQRPHITEADRSTIFWTSAAIGLTGTVLGVLLSGFVAEAFGTPEVQKLFAVTSISFLLSSLSVTPAALMTRRLAFRSLQIREILATACGAVVAVTVAVAGFGPWAIVANWVTFSAVSTLLLWLVCDWRPHFLFSRDSLRDLGSFGLKIFGARILSWSNTNVDNVLVGRFLGAAKLGAYSLAYNVMYLPMQRIGGPLQQVVSPVFARIQTEHDRLERSFLRSKRLSCALLIPSFLVTLVVAPDLVNVVFGEKWDAAIVPLQLLCIAGVGQCLVSLHFSILQSSGQGNALLRLNLVVTGVTLAAFAAGVPFGIVGVAGFYALAKWILVVIDTRITTKAVSFAFWPTLRAGTGTLPLGAAAAVAAFFFRMLLVDEGVPAPVRLVVVSITMTLIYILLIVIAAPSIADEVKTLIRRRHERRKPVLGTP